MKLTRDQIRIYLEHRFVGQKISDRDKVSVKCIVHDDRAASMTVFLTGNGGCCCHACGFRGNLFQLEAKLYSKSLLEAEKAIAEIMGATKDKRGDGGRVVAVYDYRNLFGDVEFQKRKIVTPDGKKTFRVYRPKGQGWEVGIGDAKRVLYHLADVVTANVVLLCEGEKDCETIDALELCREIPELRIATTTNFDGAWQVGQSPKWSVGYNPYFAGKRVVVCVDNDDAGRAWASHVAASLAPVAHSIKLLALPGLSEKGDVSDWMLSHTREQLEIEIKNAPHFQSAGTESKPPLFVSAGAFMSYADSGIDWLINGVIQRGANGFIAAEPKAGKSWVSADLSLSLATGTPWLGFSVNAPTRVALVSREDNPALTSWRLKSLLNAKGLNPSQFTLAHENLYINSRRESSSLMLDNPAELNELISELNNRHVEFCVLDVLNVLHSADENDNTSMRSVLRQVSTIQSSTGCAVAIVHHFNKDHAGRSLVSGLRGSSAIAGFAEWIVGISIENKEEKVRTMEFESKAAEPPERFCFKIDSPHEGQALTTIKRVTHELKEQKPRVQFKAVS